MFLKFTAQEFTQIYNKGLFDEQDQHENSLITDFMLETAV